MFAVAWLVILFFLWMRWAAGTGPLESLQALLFLALKLATTAAAVTGVALMTAFLWKHFP